MLDDLELGDTADRAQDVDHRQRVHDGAVATHHEVGAAADDLGEDMQAAAAGVGRAACAQHVAAAVADERLGVRAQTGHYRLADVAFRGWLAVLVQHFEDDALADQQHLALGRLVGGEADVAAAELVGDRGAEYPLDQAALIGV